MIQACPINRDSVGELSTRVVAGFVLALSVAFFATGWLAIPLFLSYDFASRALLKGRFSLLRAIARSSLKLSGANERQVNAAPKLFAARMGLAMSLAILLAVADHRSAIAYGLMAILVLCAALEAVAGYCVGCKIYTILGSVLARRWRASLRPRA